MAAQTERQARSIVQAFDGIAERTVAISSSAVYPGVLTATWVAGRAEALHLCFGAKMASKRVS